MALGTFEPEFMSAEEQAHEEVHWSDPEDEAAWRSKEKVNPRRAYYEERVQKLLEEWDAANNIRLSLKAWEDLAQRIVKLQEDIEKEPE